MKISRTNRVFFFLSSAIGGMVFLILFGVNILNPTNVDWLLSKGDLTQHYLGWCFFRNSPWQFPWGLHKGLSYPYSASIIFTDSIPLWALVFKCFRSILPIDFQYFGFYGLFVFAMQGLTSSMLFMKLTKNQVVTIIGSCFFIFSPILFLRVFGHHALSSHYIILLALLFFFDESKGLYQDILRWGILAFLAVGTHFMFVPMVMIICFFSLIKNNHKLVKSVIVLFTALCVCVFSTYLYGGFSSELTPLKSTNSGGLGLCSFNLNSFINPIFDNGSVVFHPLLQAKESQGEGYSYLGLGLFSGILFIFINILVIALKGNLKRIIRTKVSYHAKTMVTCGLLCVTFLMLALSPVVTLNNKVLFNYYFVLPKPILGLWEVFRSTGRFIWPVYYLVTLGIIAFLARLNKTKVSRNCVILSLFLVIQLIDILPFEISSSKEKMKVVYENRIHSKQWSELAQNKDHLLFSQVFDDVYHVDFFSDVYQFAYRNKLTTNTFYFARYDESVFETMRLQLHKTNKNESKNNTMIVFVDERDTAQFVNYRIKKIDNYWVGY